MQSQVRVACATAETRPGALEANLQIIDHWCAQAARAGAELVLFQELSLSGFLPNHPVGDHNQWLRRALQLARQASVRLDGPIVEVLCRIAARHRLLVSVGVLEDAGNLLFNTQLLAGANGLLGRWRKMHIPMFEMPFYNGGGVPDVVETPLGRIGVNICFDALLPESTRLLAVQNAEIVLFPFAADPPPGDVTGWQNWAATALSARCAENGVFGLAANYVGTVEAASASQTFPGGGMVLGPRGERLADWNVPSGQPGLLVTDLHAANLEQARAEPEYLFRFRRPELYSSLAKSL